MTLSSIRYSKKSSSFKENVTTFILKTVIRLIIKLPSKLPVPLTSLRNAMESTAGGSKAGSNIESILLGGIATEQIEPKLATSKSTNSECAVLHLHGGAFFGGSLNTHRDLGIGIANKSGATVYMLSYRLAPEHPYPAALKDGLAAYQALLEKGYLPNQIMLSGDSAGGNLALALLVHLRDLKIALPAAAVLISPFLDMTLSADSFKNNASRDPMLTEAILKRGADAYRKDIELADARISPIFADLSGLPPMLIQVGSEEVLLDDSLRLAQFAQRAGVEVDCHVFEGMWHNFQMMYAFAKTADDALEEIGQFIKKHLSSS
jgi:epsilon-lactone hydrolase